MPIPVGDSQCPRGKIRLQSDFVPVIRRHEVGIGQRLESEPVQSIGGVWRSVPSKNLSLCIERVDHEAKKLPGLSLEWKDSTAGAVTMIDHS